MHYNVWGFVSTQTDISEDFRFAGKTNLAFDQKFGAFLVNRVKMTSVHFFINSYLLFQQIFLMCPIEITDLTLKFTSPSLGVLSSFGICDTTFSSFPPASQLAASQFLVGYLSSQNV